MWITVLLVRHHLKYVWFTKFTKFWNEVKNGSSLGISKNKKNFQLQGASLHWPPDQGLCPKMYQQYYRTVLLPGSVYVYCLIVPHRNCMRKKVQMTPFQLAKMKKNRRFQGWFFENFSGDIAPRPPYWGGATAPLPRPNPRSGPSSSVPPAPNLPLHHW